MRLKYKIPLVLFSALFIVVGVLMMVAFVNSSHRDSRTEIMIESAKNKAQVVGGFMSARVEELKKLEQFIILERHLNDKEKLNMFHKHMHDFLLEDSTSKLISDLYVAFERGAFFSTEATKEGYYYSIDYFRPETGDLKLADIPSETIKDDEDWYLVPKKTGKLHLIEPYKWKYPGEENERLMITISHPIFLDGKFAGTIGMDMELAALQRVFFDNLTDKETGIYLSLISHEGLRATHPNEKMWLTEIGGDLPKDEQNLLKESIRNGKEYSMITDNLLTGKKSIVSFVPLKPEWLDLPWSVCMVVPLDIKAKDIENYPLWILQRQLPYQGEQIQ
jgi:methyl-accepting chemotaxis protein